MERASGAERSEAKRSKAKRSEAKKLGKENTKKTQKMRIQRITSLDAVNWTITKIVVDSAHLQSRVVEDAGDAVPTDFSLVQTLRTKIDARKRLGLRVQKIVPNHYAKVRGKCPKAQRAQNRREVRASGWDYVLGHWVYNSSDLV